MDTERLHKLGDLTTTEIWFWLWFAGSAIVVGVVVGNVFSDGAFDPTLMFVGIVCALVANIPVWVIFDVLRRILLTKHAAALTAAGSETHPES